MEREALHISTTQLRDVVYEQFLSLNGVEMEFKVISKKITGTSRHGNHNTMIVQRSDGKFFTTNYEDSVKDSCDFGSMNFGGILTEVFPVTKITTIYE